MIKYFFDVDAGKSTYIDDYGVELASAEEARVEAFGLAVALMRDCTKFEDVWSMTIRVSDFNRTPTYELSVSISSRVPTNSENERTT